VEDVAKLLEEILLVGDGPFGQWHEELLGEWINDVHVTQFEELGINLHSYASLTKDNLPRLETIWNVCMYLGRLTIMFSPFNCIELQGDGRSGEMRVAVVT
jgi:hypothetical protein